MDEADFISDTKLSRYFTLTSEPEWSILQRIMTFVHLINNRLYLKVMEHELT